MKPTSLILTATLLLAVSTAPALDAELRLPVQENVLQAALFSRLVEHGGVRSDDATLMILGRTRWFGLGVEASGHFAIGDDKARGLDAGETIRASARLDYVYELPDLLQLIPSVEYVSYPAWSADDAIWVTVDGWFLLPVEGVEVGASLALDAADNYGWYAAVGARQMVQIAPLDLLVWETIEVGDRDFHEFSSGARTQGLASMQLGARATFPLPWEEMWATASAQGDFWLTRRDRRAVEDSATFTVGIGVEWRPTF